jgi:hypothetical protein
MMTDMPEWRSWADAAHRDTLRPPKHKKKTEGMKRRHRAYKERRRVRLAERMATIRREDE